MRKDITVAEYYCDFCGELIEKYIANYNNFKGKHICQDCREEFDKWIRELRDGDV